MTVDGAATNDVPRERLEALLEVGKRAASVKYNREGLESSTRRLADGVRKAHDEGAGVADLVIASGSDEALVREWLGLDVAQRSHSEGGA